MASRSTMLKPRSRTSGTAIRTFSNAEYSSNRLMIWNDREIPLRAIVSGDSPVMSSPSKMTRPRSGLNLPVSTLKQVVLPAPFGPMMPLRRPDSKLRSMFSNTT